MNRVVRIFGISVVALLITTGTARAVPIIGFGDPLSDPALAGGSQEGFDAVATQIVASITLGNVTYTGIGSPLSIGPDFNGSFNTTGGKSLFNDFDLIPDAFPHRLVELLGDSTRGESGRDAAGLEHDDGAAAHARCFEQRARHARRLTGSGFRNQDQRRVFIEGGADFGQVGVDWQGFQHGARIATVQQLLILLAGRQPNALSDLGKHLRAQ